ncbi:acyltransferase ChoActase/COT/CPT [Hesseltinella vesiculosa]|uniref:Acyltransferase ChoActase/COT/CPT n=1 Tax=Hesseltinella vesiculosa TaxID=101127 RepID=A0A1X2G717_9FUNG|nr:acyltransferase ChoActase/COT/CPT [Hesseltinella vesiculosa]
MTTTTSPPTYSLQGTLPRLPVPSLEATCKLYLQTLLPLQTQQEHADTTSKVQDFVTSDLGKALQQRLIDMDQNSPFNWLEDNFWIKKAYLEWREALMVNSNYYILGKDDDHHPAELLQGLPTGQFSQFQLRRAASLIYWALDYKEILEREELPVDMARTQPFCMWQYSRIFGVTRIPMPHCDSLIQPDPASLTHVIVLACDQMYKLKVYHQVNGTRQRVSIDALESDLTSIVKHASHKINQQVPVPLLSSWHRDRWTEARTHLLALDPAKNRENMSTIEHGLFAVSLDDHTHGPTAAERSRTGFFGNLGLGVGHNRWFDKSFTLLVENNGKATLMGEHSPVDALTVSYMWDHALHHSVKYAGLTGSPTSLTTNVEHLTWTTNAATQTYLAQAQRDGDALFARSDSHVLHYLEYGTDWVKRTGKVPPDAYFQMVLQLAYYRAHGQVTPTYETASTRKYLHGRTETIRTCSIDTKHFVEAFDQANVSAKEKYDLLVKATSSHRKYTQIASDGQGCDRHLLALRLLNMDHPAPGTTTPAPMHPIFTDPIFSASQQWRLSTSGLQAGDQLMGTGFGATFKDGYGINYMAARTLIKFGIEVKTDEASLSASNFATVITQALQDMRQVCEQVNSAGKEASMVRL